ncbi:MAG: SCO family protein, partial [Oxalobacteraceae bacterium]
MKKLLPALLVAALGVSLAACDKMPGKPPGKAAAAAQQGFQNTDITGIDYAKNFTLTDHTGKPRTLADFKGKVVLMFFGYTQCPDVCPTTMAEMAGVMQKLGPQADQVQVLFVTLDPERDTQELLASYVPAFD